MKILYLHVHELTLLLFTCNFTFSSFNFQVRHFLSPSFIRDLANDVLTLMSSSKPYLRKKGILTMFKVFVKFPDALRPAFPRLKERLEDQDPG